MDPEQLPRSPGELGAHPGPRLPTQPVPPGPSSHAVRAGAVPARDDPEGGEDGEPRPTSLDPQQIGFTPRPAVPWLSPVLLAGTAVRVVLSELFGAYLDKRELQSALPAKIFDERQHDDAGEPDETGGVWFDYVSDVGDGFSATYSVAYLLAQPTLTVEGTDGTDGTELPRGRMIVMGGDQVYPTASGQQYEDRFEGPYRAAMPQAPRGTDQPTIYALPGNHDWYDGLTAFLRIFARAGESTIGGWRSRQSRSYFTIQLPHRWWLFAIDAQADAYIDDPQLRYFHEAANALRPGDRVILCTPNPSWLQATTHDDPNAYDTVDYFLRKVIRPTGAEVRVMLSGDIHHYARYSRPVRELITSGSGGAYLYGTHQLPEKISVPPRTTLSRRASPSHDYTLAATYPTKSRSRAYAAGVFGRLPWRNPGFATLLGTVHTLLMLAFTNAVQGMSATELRLATIPVAAMVLVVLAGSVTFAMPHLSPYRRPKHWIAGFLHGLVHIGFGALGSWLWLMTPFGHLSFPLPLVMAVLVYLPVAGLTASFVVSAYLLVASSFGVNVNELFAGQGIIDAKGFLRLHIDDDGTLTIYPVAVDRVARRFVATPDAEPQLPWFEPTRPIPVHLAEPPIRVL